ncbi:hypothetical protein [Burkholderia anthina]|uniref:hypothetical protein n=1 Tax=Burkholderia anthina TaxID=179879 RepID=UPI000AB1C33E|nr:hypothetical protein [Burkholderia anthina]
MTIFKVVLSVIAIYLVVDIGWTFVWVDVHNAITIFALLHTKPANFVITSIIFGFYLYRRVRNFNRFSRAKRAGLAIVTVVFFCVRLPGRISRDHG